MSFSSSKPAGTTRFPEGPPDSQKAFFRIISPDEYGRYGIDARDVPMGTFAAEDHPNFLLSRYGGNAYGLGLVEQNKLSGADFEFLQNLNLKDTGDIIRNARRINRIYQRLGLLIRYSESGRRYFLIPINLVAHSLQDIKTKADEIEELVLQHLRETGIERLDIGLVAPRQDLIVHELTARLSQHRIVLFDSIDRIRFWRTPLDIVIFPKDLFEVLLEQGLPRPVQQTSRLQRLIQWATYLSGKLYDLLERGGKFIVMAHCPYTREETDYQVEFKTEQELKYFLIYTHIFRTKKKYRTSSRQLQIHPSDLYHYLNRYATVDAHLRKLLQDRRPESLTLEDLHALPYLNIRLPGGYARNLDKQWEKAFSPYFETLQLTRKTPAPYREYWAQRLSLDRELPESLLIYSGTPRTPAVRSNELEEEVRRSGLMGCSLPLVATYRNSFRYVLDVLQNLEHIRDGRFPKLSQIEQDRISNPFKLRRSRHEGFNAVCRLLKQVGRLRATAAVLNPDHVEGQTTPVLENLEKLSLHGFTREQLKELLLIVVGHTTMSRVVFGKIPPKSLEPVTDMADENDYQHIVELLRICRVMTLAEIAASLGDEFTSAQVQEIFRLYYDAIQVATQPELDWENLVDLQISELGGVQYKAVREMMKFFNLFEFLNNWQEFQDKGPYQKEVLCDYSPRMLSKLQDALDLAGAAADYRQRFLADPIPGQTHFFRRFLETEFHGTGHLFPRLGTRAGFMLLWISVNATVKHIVNFNPILAGVSTDRCDQRIEKIRKALLDIPEANLGPSFIESIRERLSKNEPAFAFESGIRLMLNPDTQAVDVTFVDVDEDLLQLEALLQHFEAHKLQGVSLKHLQDLERLFSELDSYRSFLNRKSPNRSAAAAERPEIGIVLQRIEDLEDRLRLIFQGQIFVPEEIYDTVSVLAAHCPHVLRFILPEFHALGNLIENWPTRKKQSVGNYVMRCLQKFQALITKDREGFQDRDTFYQLAKQEFGPLAEEDTGAKHPQLEILEHLVERIRQRPTLYQAFTLGLLFQDIGKIEPYRAAHPELSDLLTHAEQGTALLRKAGILEQYQPDPKIRKTALQLIQHHGFIGHVIQGEEPVTALEHLTASRDERLLDAFVLHSILAAAAVEEGLMTEDLLDLFMWYRAVALQILKSQGSWESWLKDALREKADAAAVDSQALPEMFRIFLPHEESPCGPGDDLRLRRGRRIAAFERLLRLLDLKWVDYQDLQMFGLNMPPNFIYHKKGLKSTGPSRFKEQLEQAAAVLKIVSEMPAQTRCLLFDCLDPFARGYRVYDFHPLSRYLAASECIKLLQLSFDAFERAHGANVRNGLISFRPLGQNIRKKQDVVRELLRDAQHAAMSTPQADTPASPPSPRVGFHFQHTPHGPGMRVGFQDMLQVEQLIEPLRAARTHEQLKARYKSLLKNLRNLPYDTSDYAEQLKQAYQDQMQKISDEILQNIQDRLKKVSNFSELDQLHQEMNRIKEEASLSEEHEFMMDEFFEHHRARVRDDYLRSILEKICECPTPEALSRYWDEIKKELFAYRPFVGKEYESIIAAFIDEQLSERNHPSCSTDTSSFSGKMK